jgi:hypothetical protein
MKSLMTPYWNFMSFNNAAGFDSRSRIKVGPNTTDYIDTLINHEVRIEQELSTYQVGGMHLIYTGVVVHFAQVLDQHFQTVAVVVRQLRY